MHDRLMRRALILTVALLTACSGGSNSSGNSEVRPAEVGADLGCSVTPESTEELGVRELGKCQFSGAEVSIYTFADNKARDTYVDVAKGFGGRYVVVDKAVVTSDDSAAVDAAKTKLGGEIR